jgi:alcohol dehydrogenase class IV
MLIEKEGFKQVLIITDPGIVKAGLIDRLTGQLDGIHYSVFSDIESNPTVANCNNALKALRDFKADVVVAMGGGSCIRRCCACIMG